MLKLCFFTIFNLWLTYEQQHVRALSLYTELKHNENN